ncbi:hypothetical protein [Paenibacillus sp. GCM10027626]
MVQAMENLSDRQLEIRLMFDIAAIPSDRQ